MKATDWREQSQKKLEKKRQTQVSPRTGSPKFNRYLANFRAALAAQNYEYGTTKLLADTDPSSPMYNPYGKSIGRWCVFTAYGWALEGKCRD